MISERLEAIWRELSTPDHPAALAARPLDHPGVWAAIDHLGQRHLLLSVPAGTEAPATTTRGLTVRVARHQVAGEDPAEYMDLACLSPDLSATFAAVASDIGTEAGPAPDDERVAAVTAALNRWQWFWGVEPNRLSETDALGLFGELWFLHRWQRTSPEAVNAWNATGNARHDFQWSERSVEVKTTGRRSDGAVVHRIAHLDQLTDAETGTLYLFSLRVVRDELARNSLPGLVDAVMASLEGDAEAKDAFARKLSDRGYSPAHRGRHESSYRILGEHLYEVDDTFPRLTADSFENGLPAGIGAVSYSIDMAICDPWLRANSPDSWPPGAVGT